MPKDKQVGMYELHSNPDFHRVQIGKFTICRYDKSKIWIEIDGKEGGAFSEKHLEKIIQDFWGKNF